MIVVITGDLELKGSEARERVLALVEDIKAKYHDLIIITVACDCDVGNWVRTRCIANRKNPDIQFVEIAVKPWLVSSRPLLAQIYMSRNAMLLELGNEFHIFSSNTKLDHCKDLIDRTLNAPHKPPVTIYHPNGSKTEYNVHPNETRTVLIDETIESENIKAIIEDTQA